MRHYCITGGIGTGKSYVCRLLNMMYQLEVYDCDREAKRLMVCSSQIIHGLKSLIGCDAYRLDGSLNKPVVAEFLLRSDANKQAVNAVVHPVVIDDFNKSGLAWMESAILYDAHLENTVDGVIAVTAPLEVRLQRIMQRDGICREKALEWIEAQIPQDEVAVRADHIIVNDGASPLEPQIEHIMTKLGFRR